MHDLLSVLDLKVVYAIRDGMIPLRRHLVAAVDGVDLTVKSGQTVTVVGESGSGKTTLARAIAGLVRIHAGSVTLAGHDLRTASPSDWRQLRQKLGFIFQDSVASLSPRKSVATLLGEPFRIHRPDADSIKEAHHLLDIVGLDPRLIRSYPHELSGGQARRIGVARAIALSPALVIADEPTAGLDLSVQGEILNLLMNLQSRLGLSYLVISHNLAVVRHISDRVVVMYLGQVVEEGPAEEIFRAPAHPYTLALIGASRLTYVGRRLQLKGEPGSLTGWGGGCRFHGRCPFAQPSCAKEAPTLKPHGQGRHVRCHFPLAEKAAHVIS